MKSNIIRDVAIAAVIRSLMIRVDGSGKELNFEKDIFVNDDIFVRGLLFDTRYQAVGDIFD